MKTPAIFSAAFLAGLLTASRIAYAGSATWDLNPADSQWQNPANWTPMTVPHHKADTATFGPSSTTNVMIGVAGPHINLSETFLDKIVFTQEAPAYTITVAPDGHWGDFLEIYGAGVINDSGIVQNIVVAASRNGTRAGELGFNRSATITTMLLSRIKAP